MYPLQHSMHYRLYYGRDVSQTFRINVALDMNEGNVVRLRKTLPKNHDGNANTHFCSPCPIMGDGYGTVYFCYLKFCQYY